MIGIIHFDYWVIAPHIESFVGQTAVDLGIDSWSINFGWLPSFSTSKKLANRFEVTNFSQKISPEYTNHLSSVLCSPHCPRISHKTPVTYPWKKKKKPTAIRTASRSRRRCRASCQRRSLAKALKTASAAAKPGKWMSFVWKSIVEFYDVKDVNYVSFIA